jgi:RimJ/RimL family protein N-acetyltransferase
MLTTRRLDLVPMTLALADAERSGTTSLSVALRAAVPPDWPPDFYDDDDLDRMRRLLADPANGGWVLYYVIHREPARTLVGVAGFSGRPSDDRVVEMGYSLMPSHHGRGIATEAVRELLRFAFGDASVERVVAETFPHLPSSIGVLMRNGFRLAVEAGRSGALRYALDRSSFAAENRDTSTAK